MDTKIDLSICIVSWNTADKLAECLRSIYEHDERLRIEVIVFDNASSDGSPERVRSDFPQVNLIVGSANLGFGRGNNITISKCRGKYILLLNPDMVVIEPCFKKMIYFLEDNPSAGLVGCKLVNIYDIAQQSYFHFFPTPISELAWGSMVENIYRYFHSSLEVVDPIKVAWLVGGCMLFRADVLRELGGFDEDFFMYGEDLDLCYRLKKNGFEIYYLPGIKLLHYHGASSKRQAKSYFSAVMQRESVYKFMIKHYGIFKGLSFRAVWVLSSFLRVLLLAPVVGLCKMISNSDRVCWSQTLEKYLRVFSWGLGQEKWAHRGQP